jgi:hypothetical protein
MRQLIPNPVIAVVAEVIGQHYYNHSKLNTLFMEAGAPGDPPMGNCVNKCLLWLKHTNSDRSVDPLMVLGGILLQFMETGGGASISYSDQIKEGQDKIRQKLAQFGLAYHKGGIVLAGGQAPPVADLNDVLRRRDLPALGVEFKRALDSIESDPPAAVTAACSILESLFRVILNEEDISLPSKETIKPLWSVVQDTLGLNPTSIADDDIRRILSGLTSVVDGIGALRTHAGSAHGHGPQGYILVPRHARLTVHAAHTLCLFVIETWEARQGKE